MKKILITLFIVTIFIAANGRALAQGEWETRLKKQVDDWIAELYTQDSHFRIWSSAEYTMQALGPNSKQWLITFISQNENLGYMVIGATEDGGFILLEYGLEGTSLFEPKLLSIYHSELLTKSLKVEKVYRQLESFFLVETPDGAVVIDAKTGEIIPEEFVDSIKKESNFIGSMEKRLEKGMLKPLSNWDKAFPIEALINKTKPLELIDQIAEQSVYLRTKVWNDKINLLHEVVGYHQWSNNTVFIAIDQEGYRFLPMTPQNKQNETDGRFEPSVSIKNLIVLEDVVSEFEPPVLLTFPPH